MERQDRADQTRGADPSGYDPPSVERVISPEQIDREVQYAGGVAPRVSEPV